MKNVLMILNESFPTDERVEKESLSLIKEGFNVFILCNNYNNQPKSENYKGIQIHRIKYSKFIRNKLYALYLILPFFKWIWSYHIKKIIKKNKINILHIHDLPLSDVGFKFKKRYNLTLVCDQHEYFSNWIIHTAHYNTFLGKIVKALSNWEKYEKKYLPMADKVITIEQPLKDCYINNVGVQEDKVILLPNTPSIAVFNENNVDPSIINKYKNNFTLFYAGNIDILRSLDIVIKSLQILKNKIPTIKFVFAGVMRKNCNPLLEAKKLGVENYVDFVGWIPVNQLPSYIKSSNICLHVPRIIREEQNRTIATKIYQYVIMEKPILTGQGKLTKSFIENNKIGLSIKDGDVNDFADKVIKLYENSHLLDEFSNNCKKVKNSCYWEDTVKDLIHYYNGLK